MGKHSKLCQVFWGALILLTLWFQAGETFQQKTNSSASRKKPSSLIITRDNIRHRPVFYGPHGSTAAEFVVSAGIDTSKSTVRIRRTRRTANQTSYNTTKIKTLGKIDENSHGKFPDILRKAQIRQEKQLNIGNHSGKPDPNSRRNETWYKFPSPSLLVSHPHSKHKFSNLSVPLLRHLIASHLLQGVLNLRNLSSSIMNNSDSADGTLDSTYTKHLTAESSESFTRAEKRQFGIPINLHEQNLGTFHQESQVPVYRVVKGKLVPVPQLPPELIPVLLDSYQSSNAYEDDPRLTESIIDAAIYTLLKDGDLLNLGTKNPPSNILQINQNQNYKAPRPTSQPIPAGTLETIMKDHLRSEWRPGPRCDRLTEEICLEDSDYPSSAIMSSIYKEKSKFDLMYAEIKERESQVDGLSRNQEQAYNYDHYFGSVPSGSRGNHRTRDYGAHGGFVCPSEVHYGRPHRAKNRKGEWKVVVNVGEYTQTMRMEKCLSAGQPCNYVMNRMHSSCSQVYSYHRLLVFNKDQGLHIDAFRIPTGCTCHIRGQRQPYPTPTRNYDDYGGHVESAPVSHSISEGTKPKKKSNFSNTLWAILGGGPQAAILAQSPHFLDEVQKQITWTQHHKQFPHILKQVSPAQVLKQLLEDEDDMMSIRRQPIRYRRPIPLDVGPHGSLMSHSQPVGLKGIHLPDPQQRYLGKDVHGRRPITIDHKQALFGIPMSAAANTLPIAVKPGMFYSRDPTAKPNTSRRVTPMFSDVEGEGVGFRPLDRPIASKASNLSDKGSEEIEDGDLLAVEKAEEQPIDTQTENDSDDTSSKEHDSKINFSYHPILEYLAI